MHFPLFDFSRFAAEVSTFSTSLLNALNLKVAILLPIDTAANIKGFGFGWSSRSATAGLIVMRGRIETSSAAGNPSGTLIHANAEKQFTLAGQATSGAMFVDFDNSAPSPGVGTFRWLVLSLESDFPAADLITVRTALGSSLFGKSPAAKTYNGSAWSAVGAGGAYGVGAFRDTTDRVCRGHLLPTTVTTGILFNNTTTTRELGIQWTQPTGQNLDCSHARPWWANGNNNSAAATSLLYENGASIRSVQMLANEMAAGTGPAPHTAPWTAGDAPLVPGSTYRQTLRADSGNNISMCSLTMLNSECVKALTGGVDVQRVQKDNAGVWTTTPNELVVATPMISGVTAGGGYAHPLIQTRARGRG